MNRPLVEALRACLREGRERRGRVLTGAGTYRVLSLLGLRVRALSAARENGEVVVRVALVRGEEAVAEGEGRAVPDGRDPRPAEDLAHYRARLDALLKVPGVREALEEVMGWDGKS